MGPAGSGKTSAIATYAKAGIEVFVLFTESGGTESLLDAIRRLGLPTSLFHWYTVTSPPAGWNALKQMNTLVRNLSYEDLAKLKQGIEKGSMKQLEQLLFALEDFPDERTGKKFGDVTTWDDRRALVIDSLTGLNEIVWLTTVGYKPTAHEGEWGTAMNLEGELIHKLCSDCKCYFTLTAHIDREPDLITGRQIVTAAALGRKLAPKLTRKFGDVVRSRRTPQGFFWATADDEADLKNRSLPISTALIPTFEPIVASHEGRKKLLAAEEAAMKTGANLPSK